MTQSLHDIPGIHRHWSHVGAYTGSTDNGYADAVFVAPFTGVLKAVSAYFQGTSGVVGGTATDYFTLTTKVGNTAIGTAGPSGTVAFGSSLALFSGSQALAAGDVVSVHYGTAGGTAALDMPRAMVELQYEGA